jgi:hypothetical protein
LDAARVGRRGGQARHRRVDLATPGRTLFKSRPSSGRIAAATGSMPSPMTPRSSPAGSRPSAPATCTPPASRRLRGPTR